MIAEPPTDAVAPLTQAAQLPAPTMASSPDVTAASARVPVRPANPFDVPLDHLAAALADPSWTADTWPTGTRAWLVCREGSAELTPDTRQADPRLRTAAALVADAGSAGVFSPLGDARLDVTVVEQGDVRLDAVDVVRLDGQEMAELPYAVRALVLADALERLREANAAGIVPLFRPSRTPATGAAKRSACGSVEPLRLVLRDLRAPYGSVGSIVRVPSASAGFFDDPWQEGIGGR